MSVKEQNIALFFNNADMKAKLTLFALAWTPSDDAVVSVSHKQVIGIANLNPVQKSLKSIARYIGTSSKVPCYKGPYIHSLFEVRPLRDHEEMLANTAFILTMLHGQSPSYSPVELAFHRTGQSTSIYAELSWMRRVLK